MKVWFNEEEIEPKGKQKLEYRRARKQENDRMRRKILLGTVPSGIVDSGATSSCGKVSDPFIHTGELSHKQFQFPMGQVVPATEIEKLLHDVREPAKTVELVPAMKQDTLISIGKFADAGYFTIFDGEEVNIYDGLKARLKISKVMVIKGWRDPETGLYRIPLKERIDNLNMDTVLLNKETSENIQSDRPKTTEAVKNVYESPSTEMAI